MIEPSIWSKLHGASTHFPIALVLTSTLCDVIAFLHPHAGRRRRFRLAGTITIVLGTAGSYAAVLTGLVMTRGQSWGHDQLLRHHQFVWPAFVLITGLAAWRLLASREPSRRSAAMHLALMIIASLLVSGAGFWGGELLTSA